MTRETGKVGYIRIIGIKADKIEAEVATITTITRTMGLTADRMTSSISPNSKRITGPKTFISIKGYRALLFYHPKATDR